MENLPLHVLLVEDDLIDQLAFQRLITAEHLPYAAVIAKTVAEARHMLGAEPFEVVVTDYRLNDGTAFDLLPTILTKGTPVIVTTGLGDEAIAVKALKAGAADYLIKDLDRNYLQVLPIAIEQAIHHQQTEAALRESEQRYRQVVEHANDIIYRTDARGHFTFYNRTVTRLLGYLESELLGRHYLEVVEPTARRQVRHFYRRQLVERIANTSCEIPVSAKDGTTLWLDQNVQLLTEQARVVGFQGVARDITERKRAEEERSALERQLLEAQKLESLGVLAGGIAHDFNNLLQGIVGYIELALAELPPNAALRDTLTPIQALAGRAADLAGQMLAYSGKGHFVVRPLHLTTLVTDMRPLLESLINPPLTIDLQLDPSVGSILADSTQVRQVLMNVVINAAEAIGEQEGTITIRTRMQDVNRAYLSSTAPTPDLPEDQYALLEVSDTGVGMDMATQGRIFEPFFTTKFTGRGLGLAAVLGIVRGHGGTIHVQSAVGRGTTMTILFPRLQTEQQPDAQGQRHVGEGAPGPFILPRTTSVIASTTPASSRSVLIIEDEEAVRHVTTSVLERAGFTVLNASNGPAGIAAFQAHRAQIGCVLLDLTMPGMDGQQVAQTLQQLDLNVPIVVMSGYATDEVRARFQGQPIAGFLHKPFQPADLRAAVTQALMHLQPPQPPSYRS
jgi:PAS domain S-box-containing protein